MGFEQSGARELQQRGVISDKDGHNVFEISEQKNKKIEGRAKKIIKEAGGDLKEALDMAKLNKDSEANEYIMTLMIAQKVADTLVYKFGSAKSALDEAYKTIATQERVIENLEIQVAMDGMSGDLSNKQMKAIADEAQEDLGDPDGGDPDVKTTDRMVH